MKTIVVGYGYMGAKHVEVLKSLGCAISIVTRRELEDHTVYPSLTNALGCENPEYVIIANSTHEHRSTLEELQKSNYQGKVLVEKPIFSESKGLELDNSIPIYVGYNLRFLPALIELKQIIQKEKVISVHAYVGKTLPEWRLQCKGENRYQMSSVAGGGILRDMSHELDYLLWLFGPCQSVLAMGGHLSELPFEGDDAYGLLMKLEHCPLVSLQMNFVDKVGKRQLWVNTDQHAYLVDLIQGTLSIDSECRSYPTTIDDTIRIQHESILQNKTENLCTYDQALQVLYLIEQAEQ